MRKKILLPTDFSNNSLNAINYALDLYKNDSCQFYILNAFSMPSYDVDSMQMLHFEMNVFNAKKKEIDSDLIDLVKKFIHDKGLTGNHIFETIASYEDPLIAIKKAIEDYDIDLVIMGTKGETGMKRIVYGSLAVQVMEKSRNCPVLVVPENAKFSSLNEIVFPSSYKTHFKKRELAYLSELSKKSSASIRIIHIENERQLDENQLRHKNMLNEYFEDVIHTFHNIEHEEKEIAISNFVAEKSIDMIAFINKKHTILDNLFSQPLVKNITYHTKVPVLVMHDLRN